MIHDVQEKTCLIRVYTCTCISLSSHTCFWRLGLAHRAALSGNDSRVETVDVAVGLDAVNAAVDADALATLIRSPPRAVRALHTCFVQTTCKQRSVAILIQDLTALHSTPAPRKKHHEQ